MLRVAVAVLTCGSQVLIAQRQSHQHLAGLWEFPGGKIEAKETTRQALVRELKEELGLQLESDIFTPLIDITFDYPEKQVLLEVYQAQVPLAQLQQAQGMEGQPVRLVALDELGQYEFPPANEAIIEALQG